MLTCQMQQPLLSLSRSSYTSCCWYEMGKVMKFAMKGKFLWQFICYELIWATTVAMSVQLLLWSCHEIFPIRGALLIWSGCYDWKFGSVFTRLQILLVDTVMHISCMIKWVDISKMIKSNGKLIGLLCLQTQLLCSDMPTCPISATTTVWVAITVATSQPLFWSKWL